jgi:hypothetical protein
LTGTGFPLISPPKIIYKFESRTTKVKTALAVLLLWLCLPLCFAQRFQHAIIVVQENRTPDNLFADCDIPPIAGEVRELQ